MSVPPDVEAAAENYLGVPFNFGTETNLIRIAEHDAFVAGAEWAFGRGGVSVIAYREVADSDDPTERNQP